MDCLVFRLTEHADSIAEILIKAFYEWFEGDVANVALAEQVLQIRPNPCSKLEEAIAKMVRCNTTLEKLERHNGGDVAQLERCASPLKALWVNRTLKEFGCSCSSDALKELVRVFTPDVFGHQANTSVFSLKLIFTPRYHGPFPGPFSMNELVKDAGTKHLYTPCTSSLRVLGRSVGTTRWEYCIEFPYERKLVLQIQRKLQRIEVKHHLAVSGSGTLLAASSQESAGDELWKYVCWSKPVRRRIHCESKDAARACAVTQERNSSAGRHL